MKSRVYITSFPLHLASFPCFRHFQFLPIYLRAFVFGKHISQMTHFFRGFPSYSKKKIDQRSRSLDSTACASAYRPLSFIYYSYAFSFIHTFFHSFNYLINLLSCTGVYVLPHSSSSRPLAYLYVSPGLESIRGRPRRFNKYLVGGMIVAYSFHDVLPTALGIVALRKVMQLGVRPRKRNGSR